MKNALFGIILLISFVFQGCDDDKKYLIFENTSSKVCEDNASTSALKDKITNATIENLKNNKNKSIVVDIPRVRRAISKLSFNFEDITAKDSNNCKSNLKIVIPQKMLDEIEKDFKKGNGFIDFLEGGFNAKANNFTKNNIDYNVEMTEDGKSIYDAKIKDAKQFDEIVSFVSRAMVLEQKENITQDVEYKGMYLIVWASQIYNTESGYDINKKINNKGEVLYCFDGKCKTEKEIKAYADKNELKTNYIMSDENRYSGSNQFTRGAYKLITGEDMIDSTAIIKTINSKYIYIYCLSDKSICKTEAEVATFLNVPTNGGISKIYGEWTNIENGNCNDNDDKWRLLIYKDKNLIRYEGYEYHGVVTNSKMLDNNNFVLSLSVEAEGNFRDEDVKFSKSRFIYCGKVK